MVTGVTPDRVTTDGHDSYPRAIQTTLGADVRHRDSRCLNNQLEQDHRGVIDQAYLLAPAAAGPSDSGNHEEKLISAYLN